jgi:phage tail sheath protein FI
MMPAIDIMPIGTSSATVLQYFQQFIENRVGLMGHGQCPADMSPAQAIDWRMGVAPNWTHAAFDSHNISLMYGRPTVFDVKNNARTEIPALAYLAAAITKTDEALGPHWSPFGLKRGKCSGVLDLDYNVGTDRAGADLLAEYGINNLRIIMSSAETYGDEGAVLWGGWTSQRIDSAMKEFPVTRLIKTYERMLMPVLLQYINDPNHPVTWREIHRILEPMFRRELMKYAVYGYFIQTDKDAYFAGGELKGAYLNTGTDIDQGKYRCRILIQPMRQIFYLISEMGVMRTGEPFSNYSTMYQLPGWVRK